MKFLSAVRSLAFIIIVVAVSAQTPETPKPGPEHQRLGYFAGNWTKAGNMKPTPLTPGGKFSANERNEWMSGGFFLVSHSEWKDPMEQWSELTVLGYDAEEGVYTDDEYASTGETTHFRGAVASDTWTWTTEKKVLDKSAKMRVTIKELSPTSYNFKAEVVQEGGAWLTILEGKATKIQ